jgi:hypothetical protein
MDLSCTGIILRILLIAVKKNFTFYSCKIVVILQYLRVPFVFWPYFKEAVILNLFYCEEIDILSLSYRYSDNSII